MRGVDLNPLLVPGHMADARQDGGLLIPQAQAPCCPTPASSGVGSGAGPSLGSGEINHRGAPCQGVLLAP